MAYERPARPEQEQAALPRRTARHHLEPQLREERGAGHGTPFAPFTPGADPDEPDPDEPDSDGRAPSDAAGCRPGPGHGRHTRDSDDD